MILILIGCACDNTLAVKSEYISVKDSSKHLVFLQNDFVEYKDSNGTLSLQFFKRPGGKFLVSPVGEEGETRIDGPQVDLDCDAIIVNEVGNQLTIQRDAGKPTWSGISGLFGEWKKVVR